jgi:DNA repair protein RadA/Sms
VLERFGVRLGRSDLFGASCGGAKVADPDCDLALAAALVSAASGVPVPADSAFVGEVGLTGLIRGGGAMAGRLAAARAAGVRTVFAPPGSEPIEGIRIVPVRHVKDALTWATGRRPVETAVVRPKSPTPQGAAERNRI